jgi:hypothetical protein
MFKWLAKDANKSLEPQPPYPGGTPNGAHTQKPALPEPPYKPYDEESEPPEAPYEPYKGI